MKITANERNENSNYCFEIEFDSKSDRETILAVEIMSIYYPNLKDYVKVKTNEDNKTWENVHR